MASLALRQALGIKQLLEKSAGDIVHWGLALPWYEGEDADSTAIWSLGNYRISNLSTTPIIGIIAGSIGTLFSLAQLVGGAALMLILCFPALADYGNSREYLKTAAWTALCGAVMVVAYPCMIVYGHTVEPFNCCIAICTPESEEDDF